ncbi:MAG TPA: DUF131 domain-containing protein [Candidatus Bathyarchaeia archaeon]|nr:DUF131 domain-containing protein [Candidatus Bathyarchaeia archaeon]
MADQLLSSIGVALLLVGFAVAFIAMMWLMLSGAKGGKGKVRGGGAVIIGPIPIVFGTDKESVKIILILSIVLVVLLFVFTLFSYGIFR